MAEDQAGDEPVKFVESERAATPADFDAEEVVDDLGMWWNRGVEISLCWGRKIEDGRSGRSRR